MRSVTRRERRHTFVVGRLVRVARAVEVMCRWFFRALPRTKRVASLNWGETRGIAQHVVEIE